jgi:hypothetical protein
VNSEDEVAALGELPMVIHEKEVSALVEELPVNSEDEVAALGELPMVIHEKEVSALVEELPVNSKDEKVAALEEMQTDTQKEIWRPCAHGEPSRVLAKMVAPGTAADTGSRHRWLEGTSCHGNGTA